MYTLIIFLTSLAGIVAMIFYRQWEMKCGKVSPKGANNAQSFISYEEIVDECRRCYTCIPREKIASVAKQGYELSVRIAQKTLDHIEHIPLKKKLYSLIDHIQGRQEIYTNGKSASPFIKDILSHKENFRRRESEEGKS